MSYVEIYKVEASGDVVSVGEGSNNHTFAPLVWDFLGYKYKYMNRDLHPYSLMDPGLREMFKEWPSSKMSRMEQILLGSTFDFVWVKREILPELIEACEWFLNDHVLKPQVRKSWTGEMVTATYDHRTLQGDDADSIHKRRGIIACLKEIYEDPTALGAAFNCCSAVATFWWVYEAAEGNDDEGYYDDPRPYNVLKDKEQPRGEYAGKAAWELSEQLE